MTSRISKHMAGIVAGATAMYFLDRDRGARRRGQLRDQLIHLNRKLETGLDAAARDARNRSSGLAARARRGFRHDDAPDAVIEERVRSELGRAVSHPGAITVNSRQGRVTLTGAVLSAEAKDLVTAIQSVRGVREIDDRLEVHRSGEGVPGLQGAGQRPRARPELLQENWTPALRGLVGGLGAAALLHGRRASGVTGGAEALAGAVLLARAATNLPVRRLVGVNTGRRAVSFQKTINVAAPVEAVWALWSHFENFPRFMSHLDDVRITGDGRSRWVATGPAGTRFEWEAEITRWVPQELIAWKSVEGATVASAGVVRFESLDGSTRIDIRLSYSPPAGAIGHVVASLFGSDPKRAMDQDLLRLKSLLELDKATADGGTVTREALDTAPGTRDDVTTSG